MGARARSTRKTVEVRFTRVNAGRDVYQAMIYIDGKHFGYVYQRRGGKYQAHTARNRFIGEEDTLGRLRERIIEHYGANDREKEAVPA